MAGFSKIYCIGGLGGHMGADGINPIHFQILIGNSDRMWLESRYFDDKFKPIGKIHIIVPKAPDDPNALIDACIAFAPDLFEGLPSMKETKEILAEHTRLDFGLRADEIPDIWKTLRKEAMPIFEKLHIFAGPLTELDVDKKYLAKPGWY